MRRIRGYGLFFVSLATGWLVVGPVLGLGGNPALAGTCDGTTAWVAEAGAGTQYGAKVGGSGGQGILIVDPNPACAIVRSTSFVVDENNFAEVGEFIDPTGLLDRCQTFGSPHLLVYAQVGTTEKCKQDPPSLTSGTWREVRAENPGHDNRAYYYLDGGYQGYYTIAFNQGQVFSFDERKDTAESLHANMDGLRYMGSAGGWSNWPDQTHYASGGVTGWNFCEMGDTQYRVISGSCS